MANTYIGEHRGLPWSKIFDKYHFVIFLIYIAVVCDLILKNNVSQKEKKLKMGLEKERGGGLTSVVPRIQKAYIEYGDLQQLVVSENSWRK